MSASTMDVASAGGADRWTRLGLAMAEKIRAGTLTLALPCGTERMVARSANPQAVLAVRDRKAFRRLLLGGNLGLAEAYVDGLWDSPDVGAVMRLAAANEEEWRAALKGRPMVRLLSRAMHMLRANTRAGAKRNILSHYDLGNDFYAAWLDRGMVYSSARFTAAGQSLEAGQDEKIRALCRAIGLRPGQRLLEIGCGWGRLAEVAAREFGAEVTGITLSPAQLKGAEARIAAAGLSERVSFRLQDYRDVTGTFDAIASVEMFEAVGERYWPAFFRTLNERLAPGGAAGLQIITIADRLWDDYRRGADFIQRHIFPGGMLPCPARLRDEAGRAGLRWQQAEWFGTDYAETLARWQMRFQAAWPEIALLPGGFDARFKRLWEYYLHYCEAGFRAGWTDVGQIVLRR